MRTYMLSATLLGAMAFLATGCEECKLCQSKPDKCVACGQACPTGDCEIQTTSAEPVSLCGTQACVLRYAEANDLRVQDQCPCGTAGTVQFQRITNDKKVIQQYCGQGCYNAHAND